MGEDVLPVVSQAKLLGVIITDDLKWTENTKYIIKKANARMELLRKISKFSPPIEDMKNIYILYIRSILEQSCSIWHSDLTEEDFPGKSPKNAFRNILQDKYEGFTTDQETFPIESEAT